MSASTYHRLWIHTSMRNDKDWNGNTVIIIAFSTQYLFLYIILFVCLCGYYQFFILINICIYGYLLYVSLYWYPNIFLCVWLLFIMQLKKQNNFILNWYHSYSMISDSAFCSMMTELICCGRELTKEKWVKILVRNVINRPIQYAAISIDTNRGKQ